MRAPSFPTSTRSGARGFRTAAEVLTVKAQPNGRSATMRIGSNGCRSSIRAFFEERVNGDIGDRGWLWGLSLIVLTMAIHATAVVMLAVVAVRIRMRWRPATSRYGDLIAIVICVVGVIGLLSAVLHGIECGIGQRRIRGLALELPHGRLALSPRLDEHARRIRADAGATLADDRRAARQSTGRYCSV